MKRTPSQNVSFVARPTETISGEPPGRELLEGIRAELTKSDYDASEPDIWRDVGWATEIKFTEFCVEVCLANAGEPDHWMAQIAVCNEPGFFSQLLGRRFVSREFEVLEISRAIDGHLKTRQFKEILWCLDDFPTVENGSITPSRSFEQQLQ